MPKSKKKAAEVTNLTVAMTTEVILPTEGDTGDAALDALMAELNGVSLPGDDEVVLPSEPEAGDAFETTLEAASPEDLLEKAVSGAETLEAYDLESVAAPVDAVAPTEAAPGAVKAPKEKKVRAPKEPKPARTFYGLDKLKRLTDRGVAAVMLKSEESLTGPELEAAQQRTLDVVAKSNQKVKNRTTNILEFVTGKTAVLNNLIRVCFNLVEKDGVLTTGVEGNMWATMRTCYGDGTIKSGGINSVAALRDLQVIIANPSGKGYVMNPDSAIYPRIKARLEAGAATVAVDDAEEVAAPAVEAVAEIQPEQAEALL